MNTAPSGATSRGNGDGTSGTGQAPRDEETAEIDADLGSPVAHMQTPIGRVGT